MERSINYFVSFVFEIILIETETTELHRFNVLWKIIFALTEF